MKLKKWLAVAFAMLLITVMFSGCGGGAGLSNVAYNSAAKVEMELAESSEGATAITPENQKLIRTLYLDAETEDLDDLLTKVDARIVELGGYVQEREVTNDGLYYEAAYRHASLTIRIPAENLDSFVSHVSEASNITSNRETTEDVTLRYVETESRIAALEVEQTRLLELLAKAEDMESLLLIEARLTEVREELERVKSQLRVYDNLVDYGTIYLELTEVEQYTQPEPETFWERISSGFGESLQGVGNGIVNIFVFLIVALPYLVAFSLPVIVVLIVIKIRKKKNKEEK